ncbi:MAG TPA: NAD(P)H-binding protein [Pseudonocardiaceae bacterium]|jgi:uncharacterized protein YbjT (DUF2867 family)|nr:NAD(P)H-binding protein [Pseudonocardiaceae bacterium]
MTILVTGATGSVGRHVVAGLLAAGASVRALTRRPEAAGFPADVEVVGGDLADLDSVRAALRGVSGLYLFPVAEGAAQVAAAAREAGVGHVVVLSSGSAANAESGEPGAVSHRGVERAVESAGLSWTHLRPGAFASNTLAWRFAINGDGVVREPFGAAAQAVIHEADIAAVAVRALLEDTHAGRVYPLTGPAAITRAEQARVIGAVLGREVRFVEIPQAEGRAAMSRFLPQRSVDALLNYLAAAVDQPDQVSPVVEQVTERPARSFEEWVRDRAADFR